MCDHTSVYAPAARTVRELVRTGAHVSWLAPVKVRTTIIAGSARILVWDDAHPTQRVRVYDTGVELAEPPHPGAPAPISYRAGAVTQPVLAETEPLSGGVREFAAAAPLRNGSPI